MSTPLFDALQETGERITQAESVLICLDFDGTLTPLIDDPAQVVLPKNIARVLAALADCPRASLVILSGRERADLQARVDIPGVVYAGNHGLEISGPGFVFVEPAAVERAELLRQFAVSLQGELSQISGALVEDKGLTITVHYRQVAEADCEEVRRIVHAALAASSHPFLLCTGEKIYEIRPRVYWNKGSAVGWIKERLQKPEALVLYVGDDVTDEDAFAALPEAITVRVGASAETAAQYHVEDLVQVRKLLEWVTRLLQDGGPGPNISDTAGVPARSGGPT